MKQINVRLLAILFLTTVGTLAGSFVLYKFQKSRNAKGLLTRAEQQREAGDLNQTVKFLGRYLSLRPNDNEHYATYALAMHDYAKELREAGNLNARVFQAAHGATEEAIRRNPDNEELRLAAIDFGMTYGRFSDASSHLQYLIKGDWASRPELTVKLASCMVRSAQASKAIPLLAALIGFDPLDRSFNTQAAMAPNNEDAYELLASVYLIKTGDVLSGNKVIDQLVRVNPDSYRAHLFRAQYYRVQNRPEYESLVDGEIGAALRIAPDEPATLITAAENALQNSELDRAKKLLDHCLQKHPDNVNGYRVAASWALKTGNAETAIGYLNKGLEYAENNPNLLWARANIELDRQRFEDLAKTREQLVAIGYTRPLLEFLDARKHLALKNWHKAAQKLEEVRPQIEQYRPAWVVGLDGSLALCYENLGQHDLRYKACQRILEREPHNLQARWGKVQSLLALGQVKKVVAEYATLEKQIQGKEIQMSSSMAVARLQLELLQQDQLPESQRNYQQAAEYAKGIYELGLHKDIAAAKVLQAYFVAIKQPEKGRQLIETIKRQSPNELSVLLADINEVAREEGVEGAIQLLDTASARLSQRGALGEPMTLRLLRCELMARVRPDEAREQLKVLEADLDSFPKNQQISIVRGMGRVYLYLLKDYTETRRLWQKLAQKRPNDILVRVSLFELAAQDDDEAGMQDAIRLIEELEGRESEESLWARAVLISWRVRQGKDSPSRLDEALGLVDEALSLRDSWDALYRLQGDIQVMRGRHRAGIEALEKSLQMSAGQPAVYQSLARLYHQEGRLQQAERMLNELPSNLWTKQEQRIHLDIQAKRGRLPEKIPSYDKESNDPDEHFWVAKLLTNVKRFDEAKDAFDRGLALTPEYPEGWLLKIRMHLAEEDDEAAREVIRQAELNIAEKDTPVFLGKAFTLLQEWDTAQGHFEVALQAEPANDEIKRSLADVMIRSRNGLASLKYLDELLEGAVPHDLEASPTVRWARRAKARVFANGGSYQEFTEALNLIEHNAPEYGVMEPADMVLWASLSATRPDGFSRQQAIRKLEDARDSRQLIDVELRALADLYRRQDRWTECKSVMLDLLADNPNDLTLLDPWLAWLLDHDELQLATKYIDNCPDGSVAKLRTLAHLDARRGNSERAMQRLAALVPTDLQSKDAGRLRIVATILEQLGEYDARTINLSERVWRRYLKFRPEQTLEFAAFLGRQGGAQRIAESLDLCGKALQNGQYTAGLQLAVSILRRNRSDAGYKKEFEDVVRGWFDKAQQAKPDDPTFFIQRSEFEDVVGQNDLAKEWLRRYLNDNKDATNRQKAVVSNNLAYMLALDGDREESYELIQVAMKILGPTADLRDTLGMVYLARGQHTQAIREIEAAIGDGGVTAFKYVHLAMAHNLSGDKQAATDAILRAHELGLELPQLSALELTRYGELIDNLKRDKLLTDQQIEEARAKSTN